MDLTRLEEFLVIAEEAGIKKAAQRLNVAPATLSSRLLAFERELGVPLFVRGHSSLRLTEAGVHLQRNAAEITEEAHHLVKQMQLVSSDTLHRLRIGIFGSKIPFHIGPFLDIMNLHNPHMRIDLLDETAFSFPESLLSGDVDLCIGPVMRGFCHEEIICQSIASANPSVLMPNTHPLAQAESVSIRQLEKNTFILYPKSSSPMVREFQLSNIRDSLNSYELYDSDTSLSFIDNLVPIGKGLLITPFYDPTTLPYVIRLPLTGLSYPAPDSILYLKHPQRRELKTFVADFNAFIKENISHDHRTSL